MKLSERKAYVNALKKFREKVEQDLPSTEYIRNESGEIISIMTALYTKYEFWILSTKRLSPRTG